MKFPAESSTIAPDRPRVSILIPNFNNGRQSSTSGDRDFIGDLLQSLLDTLASDPTPFEIIAYDDGSTDDSLETLRQWSRRTWPDGRPFLQLIVAPHCGYLSRTANVLCRKARGEILVRLDGDIVCLTPQWVSKICQVFDLGPPRLGIVGPKQLGADMRIHAMGDWVLHPNGYIHVGSGLPRYAIRWPVEVDHIMGCFHCMKRAVYDEVGGYDESFLRGQTEDLGLAARLKGWSALAVPHVEFVHLHTLRKLRETTADSMEGIRKGLRTFEDKWGFSRLAPDLDEVRRRYAGTPLLWNARWFGSPGAPESDGAEAPASDSLSIERNDWSRLTQDADFRRGVEFRYQVALEVIRQITPPRLIVQLACGQGLLPHMLALRGFPCLGIDTRDAFIDLARRYTRNQTYSGPAPRFEHQSHPRRVPLADDSADLVLIFDELEKHANPVALLREARRILAPGRTLAIVSQRKNVLSDGPTDPEHRYLWKELITQVQACGFLFLLDADTDDPKRDMIVVASKPTVAAGPTAVNSKSNNGVIPEPQPI